MRLVVERRRLSMSGTTLREEVWRSSPPAAPPNLPPASTTAPTTNRVVATGIAQTQTTPIFRYYANDATTARPTLVLSAPLSTTDLARVAMIDVAFTAKGKRAGVGTAFQNQILNRSPTCVT